MVPEGDDKSGVLQCGQCHRYLPMPSALNPERESLWGFCEKYLAATTRDSVKMRQCPTQDQTQTDMLEAHSDA